LFKKKSVIQVGIIADETVKCLEDAYKWRQISRADRDVYSLSQNCLPIENRHVPTAKETPK
jgi:hypothetical protein